MTCVLIRREKTESEIGVMLLQANDQLGLPEGRHKEGSIEALERA